MTLSVGDATNKMTAQNYQQLLNAYLSNEIDLNQLEELFDNYFRSRGEIDHSLFLILNDIFESLDCCYEPFPSLGEKTHFRISEATLRTELLEAVAKIESYIASHA